MTYEIKTPDEIMDMVLDEHLKRLTWMNRYGIDKMQAALMTDNKAQELEKKLTIEQKLQLGDFDSDLKRAMRLLNKQAGIFGNYILSDAYKILLFFIYTYALIGIGFLLGVMS